MPLYEYKCSACGKGFDRLLPLARYDEAQFCECGQPAVKQLAAPAVRGDYPGYQCPITGDWIEGRKAHEANLRKHGCRVLEAGETDTAKAAIRKRDEDLENGIAETAAAFVEQLPTEKREQLGRELESGLDVTVVRQ